MNGFSLEVCVEYRDDHEEPGGPCVGCGHLPDEHTLYMEAPDWGLAPHETSPVAVLAILRRGAPVPERRAS
jgi:hypothetical protein